VAVLSDIYTSFEIASSQIKKLILLYYL
jgi:hypothetical protein